jgi:hypothetical protein
MKRIIVILSVVCAAAIVAATSLAKAQVRNDVERAPTLTNERYLEDWSYLADPSKRSGHWTEPFKYIRLDENGAAYLSTGMEVRSRYEGYTNVGWGSAPNDGYVWNRFMPYADLHAGQMRFFAQPIVSGITGTDRTPAPVDTTGADMLQAFGEIEMKLGDRTTLSTSAGRKMVSLGAGRFVDTRYGPNIPRAFDGVDAIVTAPDHQVTLLYARPVDNYPGDFDDRWSYQKSLWGAYATQWLKENRSVGFDIYYLGLLDRDAIFVQGSGRELVHTFGTRIFGDTGAWFWNFEGAVQRGSFVNSRVAAWGIGGEFGYRFLQTSLQPELRLTADVISGDKNPDDQELGTFNPLFPRGKYFGALSPIGPRNLIQLRPTITIYPRKNIAVSLTGGAYWRQSTADGIYGIAGNIVRSGKDSDARFIGSLVEFTVGWQATAELNLSASLSAFEPGRLISDTGPARTITMIAVMSNFRF